MYLRNLVLDEVEKIKSIQRALRVVPDGSFGSYTLDIIYRYFVKPVKCYLLKAYGINVIIGRPENVKIVSGEGKGTKYYNNSISGTFSTYEKSGRGVPISITIVDNQIIREYSCHVDDKKPESVIYFDGSKVGIEREQYAKSVIAKHKEIKWAIGGLGLVKDGDYKYYDNVKEGFAEEFEDVIRNTSHTVIYEDKWGYIGLAYFRKHRTRNVIRILKNLGVVNAVQLDGGHLSSINTKEYKQNINQRQYSIVKFKE